jgi:hypothetical protein
VVAEVALSLVLLIGAALLIRSFAKLTATDPGLDPNGVLTFRVSLPASDDPTAERLRYTDELLGRLSRLPSVTPAGLVQQLPLQGQYVLSVGFTGRPAPPPGQEVSANYRAVSPDYFRTLGIGLRQGRLFTDRDVSHTPPAALVDEAFVRRYFPNENPLGHRLEIGNGRGAVSEIVGVVGDVRQEGLDAAAAPTTYVPYAQAPTPAFSVLVRSTRDPLALMLDVREVMRQIDRGIPPYRVLPMAAVVSASVADRRFPMLLLALFALIALFLAAVGVYGLLSYTVAQRTREIGVRLAIGAAPPQVARLVVGHGLRLAAVGVTLGMAGALVLTRLLAAMLFEVAPFDPISYVGMALLLLAWQGWRRTCRRVGRCTSIRSWLCAPSSDPRRPENHVCWSGVHPPRASCDPDDARRFDPSRDALGAPFVSGRIRRDAPPHPGRHGDEARMGKSARLDLPRRARSGWYRHDLGNRSDHPRHPDAAGSQQGAASRRRAREGGGLPGAKWRVEAERACSHAAGRHTAGIGAGRAVRSAEATVPEHLRASGDRTSRPGSVRRISPAAG